MQEKYQQSYPDVTQQWTERCKACGLVQSKRWEVPDCGIIFPNHALMKKSCVSLPEDNNQIVLKQGLHGCSVLRV